MGIDIKNKLLKVRRLLFFSIIICLLTGLQVAHAQSPFVITSSTSSNFTLTSGRQGFYLPSAITNQIGNGFRVDATFNTTGLNANDKIFVFSVGTSLLDTFHSVINVFIENQQVIIERRVNTPSGEQLFAMPTWNTTMYEYGKNNVHLYFWIDDYAMKLYIFEGSTDLANADVKRTCELQFYGMKNSLAKTYLTDTANGTVSIVVPQTEFYFVRTEISTAQNITRTPIDMNAVQGGEKAILNWPLCSSSLQSDEKVALRSTAVAETIYENNEPLDPTSPEFKNLPISYAIIENTESKKVDHAVFTTHLLVSPVPTDDQVLIDLTAVQATKGRLELVDMMGRTVYQQTIRIEEGRNQYQVSLKERALSAGLYLVRVQELGENNDSTRFYTAKVILK
ncbi:MAG TPA: T9SS type A sorting domain-containing protein [Saprospiraceae bacterium]|nr:T9SS type A sorting domain-containing protein [Saprospiraceae bacterium]HMP22662.1 T9SS type A sorting domain-containing protein [Saprospiraceae bacterium]